MYAQNARVHLQVFLPRINQYMDIIFLILEFFLNHFAVELIKFIFSALESNPIFDNRL